MTGTPVPRFALAPDVVLQEAGDEVLLANMQSEDVFSLNLTAAHIVRKLIGGHTPDAVVAQLAAEFDGPAEAIATDVDSLIDHLIARGLLVKTGG